MNIEIKDFRKLPEEEKNEIIFRAFENIIKVLTYIPPYATLDKKIALAYPRTKELKFPLGYEICNGKNGTDDLQSSFTDKIVFIQRVK